MGEKLLGRSMAKTQTISGLVYVNWNQSKVKKENWDTSSPSFCELQGPGEESKKNKHYACNPTLDLRSKHIQRDIYKQ